MISLPIKPADGILAERLPGEPRHFYLPVGVPRTNLSLLPGRLRGALGWLPAAGLRVTLDATPGPR